MTVIDGVIASARASFVSVTPTPDVLDLSDLLAGIAPQDCDWANASAMAIAHVDPDTDIHASAEYRRMLVGVLVARVLAEAASNATSSAATASATAPAATNATRA